MDDKTKADAIQKPAQPAPETPENNVPEQPSSTQPTSEAHVQEEEESGAGVQPPKEEVTEDWETKFKRVSGKVSSLEQERNRLQQEARLLEALNEAARNDPEFMKLANKKLVEQGVLDPSVLEEVEKKAAPVEGKDKTKPEAVTPDIASHPAIQWAQQKLQEEKEKDVKFFTDFEVGKDDIVEGMPEQIASRRRAISTIAQVNIDKGMDRQDAFDRAYVQLLHPEKLKEEGEIEGMVKSQSASPSIGSASGQSAKAKPSIVLTQEEKDIAKLYNMTDEEYAKYRDES